MIMVRMGNKDSQHPYLMLSYKLTNAADKARLVLFPSVDKVSVPARPDHVAVRSR